MNRMSRIGARATATLTAIASIAFMAAACTTGAGVCVDTVGTVIAGLPVTVPSAGWYSADTRANGSVVINNDLGAPALFGCKSAKFTTGATAPVFPQVGSQDKAQLFSFQLAGGASPLTALSSINNISYWAKRSSLSTGGAAINLSLNVQVTGNSVPGNHFTTLVYEPYLQSGGQAAITNDVWQKWNATAATAGDGRWWSTKVGQGTMYSWADVQALYPDGEIQGYGFNLGSGNPDTVVAGDGLTFGATTTNF